MSRDGTNFAPFAPSSSGSSTEVQIADGNLDAFNRLRVSQGIQLLDSKFTSSKQPLLWNEELTGGATATLNTACACVEMAVSGVGDKVVRRTKTYFPYRAGQSHLTFNTFTFGAATAGVRKRVGLFDDDNGIYFEQSETGNYFIVLRSSTTGVPLETRVPQSLWSGDKLNGSGPSGITGDPTKGNILVVDLQWLGVGRIRVGFEIDGRLILCHEFLNANNKVNVYMSSATLPVTYEIEAVGAAAGSFDQICSTVIREGSEKEPSRTSSVDRQASVATVSSGGGRRGILGLRLKPANLKSLMENFTASLDAIDSETYHCELVLNPTINAADQAAWDAAWVDAPSPDSIAQVNRSNVAVDANTGHVLQSWYVVTGFRQGNTELRDVGENLPIGQLDADGTASDELVLCVTPVAGTGLDVLGSISFREVE